MCIGSHDATELAIEYHMRVTQAKQAQKEKRNRGLGGLLRKDAVQTDDVYISANSSSVLSISDIVGVSKEELHMDSDMHNSSNTSKNSGNYKLTEHIKPVGFHHSNEGANKKVEKKKGGLFTYIDQEAANKEEMMRLKHEKMNEMYMKKMQEKMAKEEEEKEKKRNSA